MKNASHSGRNGLMKSVRKSDLSESGLSGVLCVHKILAAQLQSKIGDLVSNILTIILSRRAKKLAPPVRNMAALRNI